MIQTVKDLINLLSQFDGELDVVIELNGSKDFSIDEVYKDGKNDICIAFKSSEFED